MGPALERLVARESSVQLLRHLISDYAPSSSVLTSHSGANTARFCPRVQAVLPQRRGQCQPYSQSSRFAEPAPTAAIAEQPTSHKHDPLLDHDIPPAILQSLKHGENPFDRLRFEADVTDLHSSGERLVDKSQHREDLRLWLAILRYRERLYGLRGVKNVFNGMRLRHLNVWRTDDTSRRIWQIVLNAGLLNSKLMTDIIKHAEVNLEQGQAHQAFFQEVIGGYLRERPFRALGLFRNFHIDASTGKQYALCLIEDTVRSRRFSKAFTAFCWIYESLQASGLYDPCMQILSSSKSADQFEAWHTYLTSKGDHPSPAMKESNLYQSLMVDGVPILARASRSRSTAASQKETVRYTRESMNEIVGKVHGIKRKKLSDAFCARLFATSAFSTDFVIGGLRMLGVESVGPLALKEIASQTQTVEKFQDAIRAIQASDISIEQKSIFARALLKFSQEQRQEMFDVLRMSDQHPSTYEDQKLQKQLFAYFIARDNLVEAQVTQSILDLSDNSSDWTRWNLLFQACCANYDIVRLETVLCEMASFKIDISEDSVDSLFGHILRERNPGKRPHTVIGHHGLNRFDDLLFVTNVFRRVMRQKDGLDPERWREMIRRYGMARRLAEMEKLCIDIATFYVGMMKNDTTVVDDKEGVDRDQDWTRWDRREILSDIFRPVVQQAIVSWGSESFAPLHRHDSRGVQRLQQGRSTSSLRGDQTWTRGIALLSTLRKIGVPMDKDAIAADVARCLRSWLRSRRIDNATLARLIHQAHDAWQMNLLCIDAALLERGARKGSRLLPALLESRGAEWYKLGKRPTRRVLTLRPVKTTPRRIRPVKAAPRRSLRRITTRRLRLTVTPAE